MELRRLILTQFRNYENITVDFPSRIVALTGPNGQGKTNLLEAVKYLAGVKGFSTDKNAVRAGDTFFTVEGKWQTDDHQSLTVQCSYMERRGKKILHDGVPLNKFSEHIGTIPLVAVLPGDTELIYGGSAERRAWADALISQFDPEYLSALIGYEKALTSRNKLLSAFVEGMNFDALQLEAWSVQLCKYAPIIGAARYRFMESFVPVFREYYRQIIPSGTEESPDLRLITGFGVETNFSPEKFMEGLNKSLSRDRASGRTNYGTHKDEFEFLLNDRSVRYFGSQGQQKTFITSVQMAQYEFLKRLTGKRPILLLDDIFDKLDENRVKHIARKIADEAGGQVFLTDTSAERLKKLFADFSPEIWTIFEVKNALLNVI